MNARNAVNAVFLLSKKEKMENRICSMGWLRLAQLHASMYQEVLQQPALLPSGKRLKQYGIHHKGNHGKLGYP